MSRTDRPPSETELAALQEVLARWMAAQVVDNPAVAAAERDPERGTRRWMMRLEGEEKKSFTVWFELRQRSLHVETYLAPAPIEPPQRAQEYLLRSIRRFRGLAAWIGGEDAFYVGTDLRAEAVDEEALDRVLGSLYEATESLFRPLMGLGYGERFAG